MNCLLASGSPVCMATIIFYTCIWIPFLQLKNGLATMMGFLFFTSRPEESFRQAHLPATRFEDLWSYGTTGKENVEETCSICLVEFEKEDVVSQLSRCGHVFHMHCIERWLDRNHFTCPLCRSFLFSDVNTVRHANCGGTPSRISSFLGFS